MLVKNRRQRRLFDVDAVPVSLYVKGLTTGEISAHFERGAMRFPKSWRVRDSSFHGHGQNAVPRQRLPAILCTLSRLVTEELRASASAMKGIRARLSPSLWISDDPG